MRAVCFRRETGPGGGEFRPFRGQDDLSLACCKRSVSAFGDHGENGYD